MNISDLNYIAGAVRPADEIKQANDYYASLEAGFLTSNSQGWMDYELKKIRAHEQLCHLKYKHNREAAKRSLEDYRLVQGRKSPTRNNRAKKDRISQRLRILNNARRGVTVLDSTEVFDNFQGMYELAEQHTPQILPPKGLIAKNTPDVSPVSLQLMERKWCNQFKAQLIVQTPPSAAPEPNTGTRYTEKLTGRSVGRIFEAAAYVSTLHGGFTTFVTLTFTPKQRARIFGGMVESSDVIGAYTPVEFKYDKLSKKWNVIKTLDTSLGKETSRFLDAAKKIYQRGWIASHTIKTTDKGHLYCDLDNVKVEGQGKESDFHYIWVAESPANEDGEPNPHVHLLLNWTVEPELFSAWSQRLESVWGHGFANIQRIKQPKAAGTYIIKAVGYAAKGDNLEQGLIKGNRYSIARCSRAPDWQCLTTFEADNITAVIKELGYKLEQWRKPLERKIRSLYAQKAQTIKAKSIAKNQGKAIDVLNKMQGRIIKLEKMALATNKEIRSRGVFASTSNRFCITFEGNNSQDKLDGFLLWAAGARGWSMQSRDNDFSDIKEQADEIYRGHYQHHLEKRCYWKSILNDPIPPQPTHTEIERQLSYSHYLMEQDEACRYQQAYLM
ncbi:hypothetical protein HC725_02045 [Vibrio sp. S17_S38]|uniref:rolling circle replication-associated protein n=1 Tax=Vibrio sp. S17_S38 TaxID=2720229 RepID=UPI001680680C|nr:hypothetical protein [Vibrio sp. S17_S38]MBD1572060.1 hypothetical protein [Vibrio sp. S17_S38]